MSMDSYLTPSQDIANNYRSRHNYTRLPAGQIPSQNNPPVYAQWLVRINRGGKPILVDEGYHVEFTMDGRIVVDGVELRCDDGRMSRELAERYTLSMEWVPATNAADWSGVRDSLDISRGTSGDISGRGTQGVRYVPGTRERSAWRSAFLPRRMRSR